MLSLSSMARFDARHHSPPFNDLILGCAPASVNASLRSRAARSNLNLNQCEGKRADGRAHATQNCFAKEQCGECGTRVTVGLFQFALYALCALDSVWSQFFKWKNQMKRRRRAKKEERKKKRNKTSTTKKRNEKRKNKYQKEIAENLVSRYIWFARATRLMIMSMCLSTSPISALKG